MAPGLGQSSPHPRFGSPVELGCSHTRRLLDLFGIRKTLPSEGIATEEPPPALLQIEPACAFGNEQMLKAWMLSQPGAGLSTVVTTEIGSLHKNSIGWIGSLDGSSQSNVAFGVA